MTISSCLIFCGLARGPPGARGPRFIEPPEPPVATPLQEWVLAVQGRSGSSEVDDFGFLVPIESVLVGHCDWSYPAPFLR